MSDVFRSEVRSIFGGRIPWAWRREAEQLSKELGEDETVRQIARFNQWSGQSGFVTLTDSRLIITQNDGSTSSALSEISQTSWNGGMISGRLVIGLQNGGNFELKALEQGPGSQLAFFLSEALAETEHNDASPRDTVSQATQETTAATRTFNIHALGPSGSGKTVFMASLYHRLRLRRPELAFYLKSDHDSSLYLNAAYNTISDPSEEWPEASRGINEWNFTACVQSPSGDFEPVHFCYLDYPGGVLTNPRGAEDESIRLLIARLRSANALLILLDGQAIKSLLENEPLGRRYLAFDITSSLEIAQQSRCPVHFVVTKWDLLEGNYSLEEVKERLMDDENFRDLVTSKAEDTTAAIRLIPVSAVGSGFAKLASTGEMQKVGTSMRPHNVELPLLSVLPDFMQFAYDEVQRREALIARQDKPRVADRLLQTDATERWQPAIRNVAGRAVPKLRQAILARFPQLAPVLPEALFHDLVGYGDRFVKSRTARAQAGRQRYAEGLMQMRQNITSEREALNLLELQCSDILSGFEEHSPASVLSGGLDKFLREQQTAEQAP
jgi:hypothetical protein